MRTYQYSISGRRWNIFVNIILFAPLIIFLIYISQFKNLYFFTWLPIIWLGVELYVRICFLFCSSYSVNEEGIAVSVNSKTKPADCIGWKEIINLKIWRNGEKITGMRFYSKDKKSNFTLHRGIENGDELFDQIIKFAKLNEIKIVE